jgi:hypothetical protein
MVDIDYLDEDGGSSITTETDVIFRAFDVQGKTNEPFEFPERFETLTQEIEAMQQCYPQAQFDKVDLTDRKLSIIVPNILALEDTHRARANHSLLRVDITLPSDYPNSQFPPEFDIQKTGTLSVANRNSLGVKLTVLAQMAIQHQASCLMTCVYFLVSGRDTQISDVFAELSGINENSNRLKKVPSNVLIDSKSNFDFNV